MRMLALFVAFAINFILLFYKVMVYKGCCYKLLVLSVGKRNIHSSQTFPCTTRRMRSNTTVWLTGNAVKYCRGCVGVLIQDKGKQRNITLVCSPLRHKCSTQESYKYSTVFLLCLCACVCTNSEISPIPWSTCYKVFYLIKTLSVWKASSANAGVHIFYSFFNQYFSINSGSTCNLLFIVMDPHTIITKLCRSP